MKTIGEFTLNELKELCSEKNCHDCPLAESSANGIRLCQELFGDEIYIGNFSEDILKKEV